LLIAPIGNNIDYGFEPKHMLSSNPYLSRLNPEKIGPSFIAINLVKLTEFR